MQKAAREPAWRPTTASISDPMLFVLANLKGSRVSVLTTGGECWEGVFTAFSPDSMDFALRFARKAGAPDSEPPFDTLAIQVKDLARILADDIPLGGRVGAGGFQTDSQISGQGYRERELTAWQAPTDDESSALDQFALNNKADKWDQFAANQEQFGIKNTFDENLYTTELDKTKFTKEQREHAERMAREIERKTSDNIHVAQERNQALAADFDEEDMYGAVVGTGRSGPKQGRGAATANWRKGVPSTSTSLSSELTQEISGQSRNLGALDPSILSCGPKEAGGNTEKGQAEDEEKESQRTQQERHRVRELLVQERWGKNSSSSSPKSSPGLSPKPSPSLQALQLDPALATVKDDVKNEFYQFKQDENTNNKNDVSSDRQQVIKRLKNFSETHKIKPTKKTAEDTKAQPAKALDPSKSTLNPNASSFTFNVNATEFKPAPAKAPAPAPAPIPQPAPPMQSGAVFPQQQYMNYSQPAQPGFAPMQPMPVEGTYNQEMHTPQLYANSISEQVASGQIPLSNQAPTEWTPTTPQMAGPMPTQPQFGRQPNTGGQVYHPQMVQYPAQPMMPGMQQQTMGYNQMGQQPMYPMQPMPGRAQGQHYPNQQQYPAQPAGRGQYMQMQQQPTQQQSRK